MDELVEKLESIRRTVPGLLGFVIFTREGFPLLNTIQDFEGRRIDEEVPWDEYFSAVGAGIVSLASTTLQHMGISSTDRLIIESKYGYILVERVDDDVNMMVVSTGTPSIGMLKVALRRAINAYKATMGQ